MQDTPSDPLATGMLPVVMHSLNNATQLLSNLNSVLNLPEGSKILEERAGDLGSVSDEVEALGWLLAVLASANGADLLLERRRADGLSIMVRSVRDSLRREGHDMRAPNGELPELVTSAGKGWEVSWAVGALLFVSGLNTAAGETLDWTFEPTEGGGELRCITSADVESVTSRLAERVPGARFERTPEGWSLFLPDEYVSST